MEFKILLVSWFLKILDYRYLAWSKIFWFIDRHREKLVKQRDRAEEKAIEFLFKNTSLKYHTFKIEEGQDFVVNFDGPRNYISLEK